MADNDKRTILANVYEFSGKELDVLCKNKQGEFLHKVALEKKWSTCKKPGDGKIMGMILRALSDDKFSVFVDHLLTLVNDEKTLDENKHRFQTIGVPLIKKKFATLTIEDLDKALALDRVITKEELDEVVNKLLDDNANLLKSQRYRALGPILGKSRSSPACQLAGGQAVKETVDRLMAERLGPKTEEDLSGKPKKTKKPNNNKGGGKKKKPTGSEAEAALIASMGGGGSADTLAASVCYPPPEENLQKDPALLAAHLKATGGKVVTRFPPEPNGYLHIGHAKSINLNFGYAARMNGHCYLRFDDTNPAAEKQEYIDQIIENVSWLGFEPYRITYSSDYFDELYQLAEKLIQRGYGYTCSCSSEVMRSLREQMKDCEHRNRPKEESLSMFRDMRDGKYKEGEICMRMKGNMQAPETPMRDMVAYRVKHMPHPHVGDKWCIYPSYDFTHCIVDSFENVSHSLCTLEFRVRRISYEWLLEVLGLYCPPQREFSRLVLTHVMLSKRKLLKLVEAGHVSGWDDPRMPTLRGYRRRGYTPESIRNMCNQLSVTGVENTVIPHSLLDYFLRQHLNQVARRAMVVLRPLKITITNCNDDVFEEIQVPDIPAFPEKGSHKVIFSNIVYIDRSDFREQDEKGYYGLAPGKEVRLKYCHTITCTKVIKNEANEVVELEATYNPNSTSKPKGTLHWVANVAPGEAPPSAEVRLYGHLFSVERPWELKEKWMDGLNPKSVESVKALIEPSIQNAAKEEKFQFERVGYFCVDWTSPNDNGQLIFNRTVSLKDTYKSTPAAASSKKAGKIGKKK